MQCNAIIVVSSININDGSVFKLYRSLLYKLTPDYPLMGTHEPIYSAIDKVETFADTFKEQFTTNHRETFPEVDVSVEAARISTIVHRAYTTPGTITQIIKHLLNR